MVRLFLSLIIVFSYSELIGQDLFSKLTETEFYDLGNDQLFQVEGATYLVGNGVHQDSSSSQPREAFISRVNADGSIEDILSIDSFSLGDFPVILDSGRLILAGTRNRSLLVYKLNFNFEVQDSFLFEEPDTVSQFIWDIEDFGDHYIISSQYREVWNKSEARLYWLNKTELDLDTLMRFNATHEKAFIRHLSKSDTHLYTILDRDTLPVKYEHWLLRFSPEKQLVDSVEILDTVIYTFHCTFLNDKIIYTNVFDNVKSVDLEGNSLWNFQMDPILHRPTHERVSFNTIKVLEDGNLLLPGNYYAIETNNSTIETFYLYMAKFTPDGDLLWHHRYGVPEPQDMGQRAGLEDVIECEDGSLLFMGDTRSFTLVFNTPNYHVILKTDSEGCYYEDCPFLNTSSILSEKNASDISIFPNPFSHEISIRLNPAFSIKQISISDIMGNKVLNIPVDQFSAENRIKLDCLSSGIYLVAIMFEGGEIFSEKIYKY